MADFSEVIEEITSDRIDAGRYKPEKEMANVKLFERKILTWGQKFPPLVVELVLNTIAEKY